MLLARGVDPWCAGGRASMLLSGAIRWGSPELFELLLSDFKQRSALSPIAQWTDAYKALKYAQDSEDIMRLLLTAGIDVNRAQPGSDGVAIWRPLYYCCHPGPARLLLEAGADPNIDHDDKWGPLASVVDNFRPTVTFKIPSQKQRNRRMEMIQLLFEYGADPLRAGGGWALHGALRDLDFSSATLLADKGARIIVLELTATDQALLDQAVVEHEWGTVMVLTPLNWSLVNYAGPGLVRNGNFISAYRLPADAVGAGHGFNQDPKKRWLNGDAATGTTDPDVTDNCEFWANDISSTDTCAELESYFDASISELHAWNPSLLEDYCVLIKGWSYCVEGPSVTTTAAVATGTAAKVVSFHEVSDFVTSTSAVSTASSSGTVTTTAVTATYSGGIPSPTQSGLTTSCTEYYYVKDGDSCYTIQDLYLDFTLDEFYSWNPSISSGCVGLEIGYHVCVDAGDRTKLALRSQVQLVLPLHLPPSRRLPLQAYPQIGIASDCVTYYQAVSGDSCWSIVTNDYPYLTEAEFIDMNPAVGSDCSGLWVGYDYCVATTSVEPMPGIISTCDSYYLVESGDSCYSIEQAYSITAAEFMEWNPDVGSSCASLWADYYVCVGVSS
ncbi:hypothetical protein N7507_007238 [Penicillium longicatenatum]|nr:hypothetical protein N7507_007238 [Penicillium longicatenatum]